MGLRRQIAAPAGAEPGRRRPWRPGGLSLAGALLVAATPAVPALAVVPSHATYAGGFLTAAAPLVGARVTNGRISLEAQAIARCAGRGPVDDRLVLRTAVGASGSFRGHAVRTYRVSPTESRTVSLTTVGTVTDAGRAAGTLRLGVLVRRPRRPVAHCSSGVQRWEARSISGASSGPPAPLAGVSYYGVIAQSGPMPFPLALHVSGDRSRVDTAVFRVFRRCRGVTSQDVANNAPAIAIRPDGSFSMVQRYSRRFTDSIESFTFRFAGRFSTLRVDGTLRATSILRALRTHRVIGHCDSGTVTWAAVP